jgi:hypothetical protein
MRRRSVLSDRHLGQSCTSFYRDDLKNSELSELLNGVGLTSGSVPQAEEEDLFDEVGTARFVGATLTALTASIGATAQSYYNDQICLQYADAQIAPLRDQINSQAVGGTLLGTGLGAALGGAIGVGRGVGIGAASGAIVGTGVGAANAQNAADISNSNTMRTMRNAWLPEDIRHRRLERRCRLTVLSKAMRCLRTTCRQAVE